MNANAPGPDDLNRGRFRYNSEFSTLATNWLRFCWWLQRLPSSLALAARRRSSPALIRQEWTAPCKARTHSPPRAPSFPRSRPSPARSARWPAWSCRASRRTRLAGPPLRPGVRRWRPGVTKSVRKSRTSGALILSRSKRELLSRGGAPPPGARLCSTPQIKSHQLGGKIGHGAIPITHFLHPQVAAPTVPLSETLKHRSLRQAQELSPSQHRILESLLMDAPLRPYDVPRSPNIASCMQRAQ